MILSWLKPDLLTQMSSRGGLAQTDDTAVAVRPKRRPPIAVVMTQTEDTCADIALT
jgi:hypothetical protein